MPRYTVPRYAHTKNCVYVDKYVHTPYVGCLAMNVRLETGEMWVSTSDAKKSQIPQGQADSLMSKRPKNKA
jgi:hypothetical protein